jgi:CRISPR-associated protein Csb2
MVAGNAELLSESQVAELPGEVWHPAADNSGTALRVATVGTLDALLDKHGRFLHRLQNGGFKPVPPLSIFRVIGYRRASDPAPRAYAAFSVLKPDASGIQSFDPLRRTRDVAGMIRHAVASMTADQGWNDERINVFVHGKSPDGAKPSSGATSPDRLQYLPLPTINPLRVDTIRRVLITTPAQCGQTINWLQRALAGAELVNQNGAAALLTILPRSDHVLHQYVGEARTWSTVTPVILPGFDDPDHLRRKLQRGCDAETQRRYLDRLDARLENLLRKAFRQAGFSDELLTGTQLEWRRTGFRAGVDLASRYLPPQNLSASSRVHVRIHFPTPIRGPIAVGSGRFRGFGLFAQETTQ